MFDVGNAQANSGLHTNASQFCISFQPLPWMDQKYVAFGILVEGSAVLDALEVQTTTSAGRPVDECVIGACGLALK
jgi:cyclophilin family peptidyl-prolyl cis-trans isomerase